MDDSRGVVFSSIKKSSHFSITVAFGVEMPRVDGALGDNLAVQDCLIVTIGFSDRGGGPALPMHCRRPTSMRAEPGQSPQR
jgi:hypothetical protein